jgi:hypothetical protein
MIDPFTFRIRVRGTAKGYKHSHDSFYTLKNNPGYHHSNIPLTELPVLFGEKYAHVIIIVKPKAHEDYS